MFHFSILTPLQDIANDTKRPERANNNKSKCCVNFLPSHTNSAKPEYARRKHLMSILKPSLAGMKAGLKEGQVVRLEQALALRRQVGKIDTRVLKSVFRVLQGEARWEKKAKKLEARHFEEIIRYQKASTETARIIDVLQSRLRNLEEAARRPVKSDDARLRIEVHRLNQILQDRDAQIKEMATRLYEAARQESMYKTTEAALRRIQRRNKELDTAVKEKEKAAARLLRETREEMESTMATCERRIRAAEAEVARAREKIENDTTDLYAANARFRKSQRASAGGARRSIAAISRSATSRIDTRHGRS